MLLRERPRPVLLELPKDVNAGVLRRSTRR